MSKRNSKKKGLKIGLTILIVFLVLLASIQLFFSFYFDTYVENQLTSMVSEQSNGQYELKMNELDLSVWGREMRMENIRLHPTDSLSKAPKVDLEQFSINKIRILPYIFGGKISVGNVHLSKPLVTFTQNNPDSLTFLHSSDSSRNKEQPLVELDNFVIENGSVTYWNPDQTESLGELNNFSLNVSDIRVDSSTLAKNPYFNFSNIETNSGKISYELNNGLYTIETNGFNFSTSDNSGVVDSLKLIPKYPRYEFYQAVGHQTDRIELTVEKILFQNPDVEKMNAGIFKMEKLAIQNADLDVFRSKALPRASKKPKPLPHFAFKNLKYPITIDTIAINQANISYTEQRDEVSETGTVTFANLNGTFTGVTNDSTVISQGHNIVLNVTTDVMKEARLDAHFEFPMQKDGSHTASGSLGSMEVGELNQILVPVAMVRAESGTIHSLKFDMKLGANKSSGWVELEYSGLKIGVLDAENVEEGGDQFFKSLLANFLKVKNRNTEEPLRRGKVSFERVPYKSIFNYWWKSLSSGLKGSIGI